MIKRMTKQEFAAVVWDLSINEKVDFYAGYDVKRNEPVGAYCAMKFYFADAVTVLANYYSGSSCFYRDISSDPDSETFKEAFEAYLNDNGFGESLYTNIIDEGEH